MYELAILTVFPAAVAFAGAMDLFTMTIPNRISLALVAGFAVLAPLAGWVSGTWPPTSAPASSCWRRRAVVHPRLDRRRRCQADGRGRPVARL